MAQVNLDPKHNEEAATPAHRYLRRLPPERIQHVQNAFDKVLKAFGDRHKLDHDNLDVRVTGVNQPIVSASDLQYNPETGNFHGQIMIPHGRTYQGMKRDEYHNELRKKAGHILADFLLLQGEHQHKLFQMSKADRNSARQSLSNYIQRIQQNPKYTPQAHIEQLEKEFGGMIPERMKEILTPIFDRE